MSNETTIDIPGGSATWFSRESLTPRRERTLQVDLMPLMDLMGRIEVEDYKFTREETAALLAVNEVAVVVFLKSWTLVDETGAPRPLPEDADDVLDIEDRPLYEALTKYAAKLFAGTSTDGFTVDSIENPDSPIGDFGV
jgi:hypothetical protein